MRLLQNSNDQTLTWTLDHPDGGNSLGLRMYQELHKALSDLEDECQDWGQHPEHKPLQHRCLIITAKSPATSSSPVWIAGGNLKELAKLTRPDQGREYGEKMSRLCLRLTYLPIPVIFSIHGQAIGGGAEFSLFGDFRLASQQSTFHFKQLTAGLCCGYGSSHKLCSLAGHGRAWDFLTRQIPVTAQEAHEAGLLHSVHGSPDELSHAVTKLSRHICTLEPLALAAQKQMFALATPDHQIREKELDIFGKLWMNPTHRRFVANFAARD